MSPGIKLISTDFDGTIFAEFENPPIAAPLVKLVGNLQARGAKWVINTGRDMSSLMEALARSRITIQPDYLVLVEREIYVHDNSRYVGLEEWNERCTRLHDELFARVKPDLPRLVKWINDRFKATVYQDLYSPFCLVAGSNGDADAIYEHLETYCRTVPQLALVRNDVYARFSHTDFNKGTALTEIARRLRLRPEHTFAAGDHWNDLPMLDRQHARWLAAPANAVAAVRETVRRQNGYLSRHDCGQGVAEGLEECLKRAQTE